MKNLTTAIIILFATGISTYAQFGGHDWSISASFNYTTSSKVFLFPNSPDPVLRDQNVPVDDFYSYSFEIRYRISEPFALGLGSEYLKAQTDSRFTFGGSTGSIRAPVKEGYSMIPVDLTAYYILPFSTERFKFQMGGGGGIYFGSHLRKFGNVKTETKKREFAYGIHVTVGMEYLFKDFLSIRAAMKFRDPQFELTSEYNNDTYLYNGQLYRLSQQDVESKVNIDGITFSLGLVFHFE